MRESQGVGVVGGGGGRVREAVFAEGVSDVVVFARGGEVVALFGGAFGGDDGLEGGVGGVHGGVVGVCVSEGEDARAGEEDVVEFALEVGDVLRVVEVEVRGVVDGDIFFSDCFC